MSFAPLSRLPRPAQLPAASSADPGTVALERSGRLPCFQRCTTGLLMCLALLAGLPTWCAASLDEVHWRLLQPYDLPLRWDNIERAPEWVSGPQPAYQRRWGMHLIRLKPGQSVTVRVDPGQWLRVHQPAAKLALEELDMAVSNGSGLYASVPVQQGADGRTLLLAPYTMQPGVVRLTRPLSQSQGLAVALFVSRREPLPEIAPYRGLRPLDTPTVRLRHAGPTETAQTFWRLSPDHPAGRSITGPTRLAFVHRLAYAPAESRMLQTYTVRVRLDGRVAQELEFFTQVETGAPVFINGRAAIVSRLEVGYMAIPPGTHRLQLEPTASLYGRLLEQQRPDYLLPGINQPSPSAAAVQQAGLPDVLALPSWALQEAQMQDIMSRPESSAAERERVALRLGHDNRRREGGLLGAMLMHDAARQRPNDPQVQTAAEHFLGAQTFFRDLLPSHKASRGAQAFTWFIARRLYALGERVRRSVAAMPHLEDWLGRLSSAYFVEVPTAPAVNIYHLPQRAAPTILRVAVDASSGASEDRVMLQLGESPPLSLAFAASPEFPLMDYAPVQAETALAMLRWQHPELDASTLGGPFSRKRFPAPLRQVGTLELMIGPEVRTVRVWQHSPTASTIRLALQYRAAKPYRLSESAYLAMVRRLGSPEAVFQLFAALLQNPAEVSALPAALDPEAGSALANHWWPLRRFLHSRARVFSSAVAPPLSLSPSVSLPALQVAQIREQAQRHSAGGQWLVALELWSHLIHGTQGAVYREAQLARVTALQHLGEAFLAEHLLRGMLLYEADAVLRLQALAGLEELYRTHDDLESLEALYATMVLRQPQPDTLQALVQVLLEGGQHELALTLGLVLPDRVQPLQALLQAALQLRWWDTFGVLLERLESATARQYWLGYQAQVMGQTDAAVEHFRQAGEPGQAVLVALEQALAIQRQLHAPDMSQRELAVLAWEQWLVQHPGPYVWRSAPELVADYAGAETLYSVERDLFAQAFRGTPSQPVTLHLWGPLQLRIDARLLHPQGSVEALDSWLLVRYDAQLQIVPMSNDRPVPGLQLSSDPAWVPGRKFSAEYSLGPGWHEVTIAAEHIPVLVQIATKQPDLPLGVLPLLTPQTLLAALADQPGPLAVGQPPSRFCQDCLLLVSPPQDAVLLSRPFVKLPSPPVWPAPVYEAQLSRLTERLVSLRTPERPTFATLAARYLAQEDPQAALALPPGAAEADRLRRMTLLLWWAEHVPEHYDQALALGEAWLEAHPQVPGIATLQHRLAGASTWTPLSSVQSSAGWRYVSLEGWQPESPALRIRKALLGPLAPEEQVLSGMGRMTVSLFNVEPVTILVDSTLADIPYLPPVPLTLLYQVDEQAPQRLRLSSAEPQHALRLSVSAGQHTLRFSIEQPVANQFVRLRLLERHHGVQEALLPAIERPFHVATRQEPVRLHIAGPTWLRLDTRREDTTVTTYRLVPPGWHLLAFAPVAGEELLRLHRRNAAPEQENTPTRYVPALVEPVPEPLARLSWPGLPTHLTLHDAYPLGSQEDGTWSLSSALVSRRNVQEDSNQQDPEQFWELAASQRYFDAYRRLYYETAGLGRLRTDGGPTLGLRERLVARPLSWPLTFSLLGTAFVQLPLNDTSTEWSASLRGTVSYPREITLKTSHRPSLSLFGRLLSLEHLPFETTGQVDQDVFTPYKAQHTRGFELADILSHRPWLDTLWWTGVSLVSNNDFNILQPDHVTLRLGWKQLLGNLQVDGTYRFSHFFADADRSRSRNRNSLTFDVTWEHWWRQQQRLAADVRLQYDPDLGAASVFLTLTWHLGSGRGYRDFAPGAVDFADIRHRRMPQQPNNLLQ